MTSEQRSKIIGKPWTRSESVRAVNAENKRKAQVTEFRYRAAQEDKKTRASVATARQNAFIALAFVEGRAALKHVKALGLDALKAKPGESVRSVDRRRARVFSTKNVEALLELRRLERENKAIDDRRAAELESESVSVSEAFGETEAERNL